ncbi:Concanavalin A-like lectin/glucanase, subgroup [Artemisia annua]|uniref:Concanavalin A-like lectin/glucanase, subgroup n=1 Tax=Artemisia annua TaxID=35608 RepID=A0A2U1PW73_ARTAN|nr:Concanavalin A-like lectin/glucanase, subgroup [Artemisia annua]
MGCFHIFLVFSILLVMSKAQQPYIRKLSTNCGVRNASTTVLGYACNANASYVIQAQDTPFLIANNTFEGLSTCHAIDTQRSNRTIDIYPGSRLTVPLRCACPTEKQAADSVKYLLSYLITWGQSVSGISAMFGVDVGLTLEANELSEQDSGVLGGVAVTFAIGFILFWFCIKKKKQVTPPKVSSASQSFEAIEKKGDMKFDVDDDSEFMDSLNSIAQSLKVYKFEELKLATNDFSPDCLIKGSVYRGTIKGDLAAIKKMHGDVSKEVQLLNTIHHHNLIRLSGVCSHDGHWYLVYEFAVNGPLSDWIYSKSLTWMQRIQIALDIANGLDYLHCYTTPPYVYKNLKSSNILLDSNFRAKITNFDLARSAEGKDGEFALTRHIVGTRGYMSPEYLENGLISTKLDVYGFGVLMLEIMTGKNVSDLYGKVNTNLSEVLDEVLEEQKIDEKERLTNFIDPRLQGNYRPELAMSVIRLIDGCLDKDPSARPDMSDVSQCLSRILNTSQARDESVTISLQGR